MCRHTCGRVRAEWLQPCPATAVTGLAQRGCGKLRLAMGHRRTTHCSSLLFICYHTTRHAHNCVHVCTYMHIDAFDGLNGLKPPCLCGLIPGRHGGQHSRRPPPRPWHADCNSIFFQLHQAIFPACMHAWAQRNAMSSGSRCHPLVRPFPFCLCRGGASRDQS